MSCDQKLINRLNRAEGQLRGATKMLESGRSCDEVLTQLMAVRSSIDRVIRLVGVQNLLDCVEHTKTEDVEDAIALLTKI